MSLLMDALRKAEREKKEAEERRKTVGSELQTENLPEPDERLPVPEITDENKIPEESTASSPALALSSQVTGEYDEIFSAKSDKEVEDFNSDMPPIGDQFGQGASTQAMGLSLEDREDDKDLFDETFHNAEIDLESVPGLYEETMQGEEYTKATGPSFEETLPGVPAAQLARDLGEEFQPTPVAAQTVFTAAGTARRRGGLPWASLTVALAIAVVAVSVIVYYAITPGVRVLPEPARRGLESPSTVVAVTPTQLRAGPDITSSQEPEPVAVLEPEQPPIADQEPAGEPAIEGTASQTPGIVAAEPATAVATVPESLPDEIDVPPGMIRISRSKVPEERGTRLADAYAAWQSGDREDAARLYSDVLENYPGNRDAMLGLAAIALSQDDLNTARQHYASLLAAHPEDELARAALIGLAQDADPVSRESALKVLIQDNPERPYLHFNLGNVFAAQRRWAEAQQAFFDAYRLDPLNPDYANNLAVSLDRIGQYETAIDYYLTALDLAKTRSAKFDEAMLLSRIRQLENPARP